MCTYIYTYTLYIGIDIMFVSYWDCSRSYSMVYMQNVPLAFPYFLTTYSHVLYLRILY